MLNFTDLPKQWVIAHEPLSFAQSGKSDQFSGLYLAAAKEVPILRLIDAAGNEVGRLLGWVISGDMFYRADSTIHLTKHETPEKFYAKISGRFVMLWCRHDGELLFREDSGGGLPAVYVREAGIIGSTVSLIEKLHPLEVNSAIEEIFEFPARRGYLPFGLTPRCKAYRLMPNHILSLNEFTRTRVWPNSILGTRDEMSDTQVEELVHEAASILRRNMVAILGQGTTVLYLSGGYDSRLILAAARGSTDRMRAETLGDPRSLDAHIAGRISQLSGIEHKIVPIQPVDMNDIKSWLNRSGRMMFDVVTTMGRTAAATDNTLHPLSGTGADIVKGTNFKIGDIGNLTLSTKRLLEELGLPNHAVLQEAGQAWIDSLRTLGPLDSSLMLDLARMEQRHGGWAGAAIYGHPVSNPSLQPFSGQRLYEITLSLPPKYRKSKAFYYKLMELLWPELMYIPVNRAQGIARLRFFKKEVQNFIPDYIKQSMKRILRSIN